MHIKTSGGHRGLSQSSSASRRTAGDHRAARRARNGEFDIVLAEALDRISRDQEHALDPAGCV
jgi:DNA invertase Pin-like site-specific DNA recombinase